MGIRGRFVVAHRTREIGLRLALGATGGSAVRLLLQDAITMIAAGVALALPCVAVLGRFLQSQVSPTDALRLEQAAGRIATALTAMAGSWARR